MSNMLSRIYSYAFIFYAPKLKGSLRRIIIASNKLWRLQNWMDIKHRMTFSVIH